ncbi:muscle LIM protein Mlp84B-like isoform X5 [Anthonomus grandis grandis]|uniref:muscle LIM protein Mlp84B-like isoform X5 n=1 Tax=Anthonomus grandis grandis TaxID=2921223 RepID=UPI0021659C3C|nr:muscle LIM protein Mlp84B-like isoform X5 [Anthonomus grandis grandis]
MPFKPVENPKCPKCQKSVYAAEERVAGGYKFHKTCFKCGLCGKMLDSTNVTEHEAELYCKNCHARKYGPKGYGFGGGAGCLSMDTGAHLAGEDIVTSRAPLLPKAIAKAPEGEGCPKCGGYVYAAEQMLARGRAFHKSCFKCGDCNKGLDSVNVTEGPDKDIYCKEKLENVRRIVERLRTICYGKKFGPKGYGYGQGGGTLQSDTFSVSLLCAALWSARYWPRRGLVLGAYVGRFGL